VRRTPAQQTVLEGIEALEAEDLQQVAHLVSE
jgi:hypothetical protein